MDKNDFFSSKVTNANPVENFRKFFSLTHYFFFVHNSCILLILVLLLETIEWIETNWTAINHVILQSHSITKILFQLYTFHSCKLVKRLYSYSKVFNPRSNIRIWIQIKTLRGMCMNFRIKYSCSEWIVILTSFQYCFKEYLRKSFWNGPRHLCLPYTVDSCHAAVPSEESQV